jgi:hypothetical protein
MTNPTPIVLDRARWYDGRSTAYRISVDSLRSQTRSRPPCCARVPTSSVVAHRHHHGMVRSSIWLIVALVDSSKELRARSDCKAASAAKRFPRRPMVVEPHRPGSCPSQNERPWQSARVRVGMPFICRSDGAAGLHGSGHRVLNRLSSRGRSLLDRSIPSCRCAGLCMGSGLGLGR